MRRRRRGTEASFVRSIDRDVFGRSFLEGGTGGDLESAMIIDAIRERLDHVPFQPFQIRASSGQTYAVSNPDLVVLMKSSVFVAAPNSDRAATVPYLHIAAVEHLTNGHAKRS